MANCLIYGGPTSRPTGPTVTTANREASAHAGAGNKSGALVIKKCAVFRLLNSNKNISLSTLKAGTLITASDINSIKKYIDDEITIRNKINTTKTTNLSEEVSVGAQVIKDNINNIYSTIKTLQDNSNKTQTSFTAVSESDKAKAKHLLDALDQINRLRKDCICHSDCGLYSVCYCYGNCGCNYSDIRLKKEISIITSYMNIN